MGKAESPSLRQKMESLQSVFQDGDSSPFSESSISKNKDFFRCLEAQTWGLMLSKLKTARISQARVRTPPDTDKDTDTFSLSPTSSRYIDHFLSSRQGDDDDNHPPLNADEAGSIPTQDVSVDSDSMSYQELDLVYSTGLIESQVSYADIYSPAHRSHSLASFLAPSFYLATANTTADMMELTY